jgi:hypothetical protein
MALDLYTPRTLLRVQEDLRNEAPTAFFRDNFFPASNTFLSPTEEILFEKIPSQRKIAPFMIPTEQGKPIYRRQGESLQSFKPAYTKPKDAVRASEMLHRMPGEVLTGSVTGGAIMTPKARYDREVARILRFHDGAIDKLEDWMAARAILDGKVTITYYRDDGTPGQSVIVDFGRDAGHTITLGAGARWGESGVSIVGNIQAWSDTMGAAAFGGMLTDIIFGAAAWAVARKDSELKDLMDLTVKGSNVDLERGLVLTSVERPITYVGTMGAGVKCWVYTGSFQNDDGSVVPIMNSKDVLLTCGGVDGVPAYGAILDEDAGIQPLRRFAKMWNQPDPSARFIMTQAAPLMIPANPNRTLKARVLG